MSRVYFISDLHLGHRSIMQHTVEVPGAWRGPQEMMVDPHNPFAADAHDTWVLEQLHSVPADKRTVWWFLGDVAMEIEKLRLLDSLPGRKWLVLGNHDLFQPGVYLKYFEKLYGTVKKYGMWVSHCPIHPAELRGLNNIHGHCHRNDLWDDPRYFNAAIEWIPDHKPISLDELRERWK